MPEYPQRELTGDDVNVLIAQELGRYGIDTRAVGLPVNAVGSMVERAVHNVIDPLLADATNQLKWKVDVSFPEEKGPHIEITLVGPKWFNDMVRGNE